MNHTLTLTFCLVLLAPGMARAQRAGPVPPFCGPLPESARARPNLDHPARPFYIDTRHLDPSTRPPTRNPHDPSYPAAIDLPDTTLPPLDRNGNFVLGPTHDLPPEFARAGTVPQGRIVSFTLTSEDTTGYTPGIARDDDARCPDGSLMRMIVSPTDPSELELGNSHPAPWSRQVDVYVPPGYVAGTAAPFLIFGDGGSDGIFPGRDLFALLDVLIHDHRIPPIVAIGVGSGGGDAQGSEPGREYDTASGAYAAWVEREVLPRVAHEAKVTLTRDPDGRATMGFSSSGAAAFSMAWFRPDLYRRVIGYSPTLANQQWPHDPNLPGGAWQLHSAWAGDPAATGHEKGAPLIPTAPRAPLRIWFEAGDRDLFYPNGLMPDGMHDWVLANENMARVLGEKGYDYQFVFSRNAGHIDGPTIGQTLPEALEWVWRDFHP